MIGMVIPPRIYLLCKLYHTMTDFANFQNKKPGGEAGLSVLNSYEGGDSELWFNYLTLIISVKCVQNMCKS